MGSYLVRYAGGYGGGACAGNSPRTHSDDGRQPEIVRVIASGDSSKSPSGSCGCWWDGDNYQRFPATNVRDTKIRRVAGVKRTTS